MSRRGWFLFTALGIIWGTPYLFIRVAVEQAARRVPIMAGCGANSTTEAIELTEYAKKVGADCHLQVVPYYNRPTQEGLYRHFKAIAEAVDIPQILYNVPGRTVTDIQRSSSTPIPEDNSCIVADSLRYTSCGRGSRKATWAASTLTGYQKLSCSYSWRARANSAWAKASLTPKVVGSA